jgi:serine/threonine-protein kinase
VHALGAVLFEILAGETLHAMTDVPSLIQATTEGVDARPGVRAPDRDVPPELDDVCVEATALDPDDRYPDVESLVADVERYLDGDRDRARRRALAQEYAARARERLEAGLDDSATRSAAIRAAGRAVAFDPDNAELAALLSRLILAPPTEIPEQVEARLQADDDAQAIEQARIGASVGLGWLGLVPVLVWMGVRSWTAVAVFVGLMLVLQVLSRGAVALRRSSQLQVRIVATVVFIVIGWSSLVFGPFMMTPSLAAMTCGMFMLERDRGGTHRYFLLCAIGTVLVPFVLELTGVLPISGAIREGTLVLFPRVAEFNTLPTLLLLVLSSVSSVYIIGKTIQSVTRMLRETRRQLALHAWHLDQLVPPAPPA